MRTNRILSAIAALALLLPAYAFATVWNFQNVVIRNIVPGETGSLTGSFTTSGQSVVGWDFSIFMPRAIPYHFFPQACGVRDPVNGQCEGAVQTATVVSPRHINFDFQFSPSQDRTFELFLTDPLGTNPNELSPETRLKWGFIDPDGEMHALSGAIFVPEPSLLAMGGIGAIALVLFHRKAQPRSRQYQRSRV